MSELGLEDPITLFQSYFAKRGLGPEIIDLNGILLKTFDGALELPPTLTMLKGKAGFVALIPYHGIDKQPVPYHVARVLNLRQEVGSFAAQMGLVDTKLVCPAGMPRSYFPLHNPPISDAVDCIITESAVKAMVLANLGYFAIGLNGCWGFSSKASTTRLLPDLLNVPWRAFKSVRFLPDSDVATNPNVSAAASRLYMDMQRLCHVDVPIIILPHDDLTGQKWGIDDFYARHGRVKTNEFIDNSTPEIPELSDFLQCMVQLNSNVSYITSSNLFALHDQNILSRDTHFHTLYAPLTYVDGDKIKPASRAWVSWDQRNQVETVINHPGMPITDWSTYYNLWRPGNVDSYAGDVATHELFLERALPDEGERRYLQQWIAHCIQRPEERKNTALVLFSPEQGTGKTMLAEVVGMMLGSHNTAHVSMDVLKSGFNSSYVAKQLIVINETHPPDRNSAESVMDKLKTLITERTVQWVAKGKDPVDIENYSAYIMTTNHANALKLDPTDRRFVVLEFRSQFRFTRAAEEWGEVCWAWHQDHISELLYYYERFDLEGFRPGAPAPMTTAKQTMAVGGYTEYELIAFGLSDDLRTGLADLNLPTHLEYITAEALARAASPGEVKFAKSNAQRMGRALSKMGFIPTRVSVATPQGRVTIRSYDLLRRGSAWRHDPERVSKDYLSASAEKY